MNAIVLKGKQEFMGHDIPVVLGGFGPDKKCMCDKTIAEIHGQPSREIRRRIGDNIRRFQNGIDFLDMKKGVDESHTYELVKSIGYTTQEITQAEHIYLLSERGYAKLIKIMDTDLAWEIHDRLIDEYFELREGKRESAKLDAQEARAKAMLLNAQTRMFNTIMHTIDNKKLSPIAAEVFGLAALEQITGKPVNYRPPCEATYSATELAREFGVSANKIGKLANANGLKTEEYGITVMDKSPHSAKEVTAFRYNAAGRERLRALLDVKQ